MNTHNTQGRKLAPALAIAALILLAAFLPTNLHATISNAFLSVDFQPSLAGATETGFVADNSTSMTFPTAFGNLTVTTSADQFFDRGAPSDSGAMTYGELYRDFNFVNGAGPIEYTLSGPAIIPNSPYQITWYAYDINANIFDPTVTEFRPRPASNTSGSIGQVTYGLFPATPTDNFQYSFTGIWTATDDSLEIDAAGIGGSFVRVNGFEIVPEPSAALLALAGLTWLLRRRK